MRKITLLLLLISFSSVMAEGYTGGGYLPGSNPESTDGNFEINRMVFTMDPTLDHFLDGYDTDVAAAHEILGLGAGNDVPEFAWVSIDSVTVPTSSVWLDYGGRWNDERFWGTAGDWNITDEDVPRLGLYYIDWSSYIPAGATILSAEMHFNTDSTWYVTANDTFSATLMTNVTDNQWYNSRGVDLGSDSAPNMAHANWSHQTLVTGSNGYTAARQFPWTPSLADRQSFEDWGDVSDWTGYLNTDDPPTDTETVINIKNCVQAAVNGAVNNGLMIHMKNGGTAGSYKYNSPEPRPGVGSFDKVPWFTVTYSTMPYKTPFPGGEFVFIFTTDDGKVAANEAYAGVFNEFGWKYSAFVAKTHFNGAADEPTAASIVALVDDGFEVGSHSRHHLSPYGISQWDISAGMVPGTAGWDSLVRDTEPDWMHHLADSLDGDSRLTHPYFGKSFATPQNELTQEGIMALAQHGYTGVRFGSERKASATGISDLFREMRYNAATSDSMRITGIPKDILREQNYMGVPYNLGIDAIVGAKAISPSEAEIKWNFRRLIRQVVARKTKAVSLYTHDLKSGGYTNGLDEAELRWMLEVVYDEGGTCMRLTDFVNWKKTWSTACATPAGYAQGDSMRFDATDAVWFKPKALNRLFPFEEE